MIFCPLIILCEVNKSLIKAQHPRLLLAGISSHSLTGSIRTRTSHVKMDGIEWDDDDVKEIGDAEARRAAAAAMR